MATLEKYYQSVDKDLAASKADVASRIALGKKDIEKQAAESISGLETDIKTTRSTFGTSEAGIQKQLGELRDLESKSKRGLSLIGYDRSKLLDFSQLKAELTEASSGIATGYQTYRAEVEKGIEQVKAIKQENIVALDKQAADIYKQLEAEAVGLKTEAAQKYVELDTGELIERNIYDSLSVEDRDYIQKNGVTAFNEYIQSGDYQFKAMQASGDIPADAIYIGYDTATGNINYEVPRAWTNIPDKYKVDDTHYNLIEYLYDNPSGEQALLDAGFTQEDIDGTKATLADYKANYKRLDTGEWIPLNKTIGEDGTEYAGFNDLTPEQQAYMQANGVEAFNTWNSNRHGIAIAQAQANYAKAMQEYINNPNTQTLYNLTQMQTELARIQDEGYYQFKAMQASGEIPAEAQYTGYDVEAGNINYQVPDNRTGEQIFADMQASGEIPADAIYIDYDATTGDINYQVTSEVTNIPDKYKVDDTHYNLVEYLYDNPSGEQALLDAGFTAEDIAASKTTLADMQANYKRLDTGEWIPLNSYTDEDGGTVLGYNDMTPQDQDYINRVGVDKYNSFMNRMDETRNEALSQLADYKVDDTHYDLVEYFVDGGGFDLLVKAGFTPEDWSESFSTASDYKANYKRLDNGDWIPLNDTVGEDGIKYAGYNSFTPEQQEYLQANGVEAFNAWLDSQSVSVVEYTKADGTKETIEQSEWDALSDIQRCELFYGRRPTIEEYQGYKLQQAGFEKLISPSYYHLVAQWDKEGQKQVKVGLDAVDEWIKAYPDERWTGQIADTLTKFGFEAAKVFYKDITFKDIKGSEWALTGLNAALIATPLWLPKVTSVIGKLATTSRRAVALMPLKMSARAASSSSKKATALTKKVADIASVNMADTRLPALTSKATKATETARIANKAFVDRLTSLNVKPTPIKVAFDASALKVSLANIGTNIKNIGYKIATAGYKVKGLTKREIANLEKISGYTGLADAIENVGKAKTRLTKVWNEIDALQKIGDTTGANVKLTEANVLKNQLDNALKQYDTVLRNKGARPANAIDTVYDRSIRAVEDNIKILEDGMRSAEYQLADETLPDTARKEVWESWYEYRDLLKNENDNLESLLQLKAEGLPIPDELSRELSPYKYYSFWKPSKRLIIPAEEQLIPVDWGSGGSSRPPTAAELERLAAVERARMTESQWARRQAEEGMQLQPAVSRTVIPQTRVAEAQVGKLWDEVTMNELVSMPKYEGVLLNYSPENLRIPNILKDLEVPTTPTMPYPVIGINLQNALTGTSVVNQQALSTITPAQLSGIEQLTVRQVEALATTYGLTAAEVRAAQKAGTLTEILQSASTDVGTSAAIKPATTVETGIDTTTQSVILPNAGLEAFTEIDTSATVKADIDTMASELTMPELKPVTRTELATNVTTATSIATDIDIKTSTTPSTITDTATSVETSTSISTKPFTKTDTKTNTKVAIKNQVKVTDITTKQTKWLKYKKHDDEELEEIKEGKKELPIGSVIWRQGKFWKALIPPYKTGDLLNLKEQPKNYDKYATGEGSAYRTVGVVGGVMPEQIDIDYGVMDIKIARGLDKEISMDFDNQGLKTDIGKSKKSKTKGITVRDKRVKNLNGYPDLPDRYYLNRKLPDEGIMVNI